MWLRREYDHYKKSEGYKYGNHAEDMRLLGYVLNPFLLLLPILSYSVIVLLALGVLKLINPISMVIPYTTQILVILLIVGYFAPIPFVQKPIRAIARFFGYWIKNPVYSIIIFFDVLICSIPTLIFRSVKIIFQKVKAINK